MELRFIIHLFFHLAVPAVVARHFWWQNWQRVWLIMVATMLVDLDHLLAEPVLDTLRCGIGFHPLHSYLAIGVYVGLVAIPKLRIVAIGLLIHMFLDGVDCVWMSLEQ